MSKRFYYNTILLGVMFAVQQFIQGIVYLFLGTQSYLLESFRYWYLLSSITSLAFAVSLIIYFRSASYRMSYRMGIAALVSEVFHSAVIYSVLSGYNEAMKLYFPGYLIMLSATAMYAATITFSKSGERKWLKIGGILSLTMSVTMLVIMTAFADPMGSSNRLTLEHVLKIAMLVSILIPVFQVMNFRDEVKGTTFEGDQIEIFLSWKTAGILGIRGILALTLILGFGLIKENTDKLAWGKSLDARSRTWNKVFEQRMFVGNHGDSLKFQLLRPYAYDSTKRYPLVVCLPYGGGVEGCPPAQALFEDYLRKQHPAFLYVPFCPEGAGWGGIPNYPTIDSLVFESILNLESEIKSIDVRRRYVTGVSRGGYGSWHFISERPDFFAAAIPVCGGGDPARASASAKVNVWAFHGARDINVPVSGSRDIVEVMKRAGGNPRYTEFPDAAHNIWDMVNSTDGVWDWLFAQSLE